MDTDPRPTTPLSDAERIQELLDIVASLEKLVAKLEAGLEGMEVDLNMNWEINKKTT